MGECQMGWPQFRNVFETDKPMDRRWAYRCRGTDQVFTIPFRTMQNRIGFNLGLDQTTPAT